MVIISTASDLNPVLVIELYAFSISIKYEVALNEQLLVGDDSKPHATDVPANVVLSNELSIFVSSLDPALDAEPTSDNPDNGSDVLVHPADEDTTVSDLHVAVAPVQHDVVDYSVLNIRKPHFFDDSVKYDADLNDQLLVGDNCINIIDDNPTELRDEPTDEVEPSEYDPAKGYC